MNIIYLSYPLLDRTQPAWVASLLKVEPEFKRMGFVLYNPAETFEENDSRSNGFFYQALKERDFDLSNPDVANLFRYLKLDGPLASEFSKVQDLFNDNPFHAGIVFKDLYVLLRSCAILVEGNETSFGGVAQEQLYAYLLNKFVALVTDRVIPGPWQVFHSTMTLQSAKILNEVESTSSLLLGAISSTLGKQAKEEEVKKPIPRGRKLV